MHKSKLPTVCYFSAYILCLILVILIQCFCDLEILTKYKKDYWMDFQADALRFVLKEFCFVFYRQKFLYESVIPVHCLVNVL